MFVDIILDDSTQVCNLPAFWQTLYFQTEIHILGEPVEKKIQHKHRLSTHTRGAHQWVFHVYIKTILYQSSLFLPLYLYFR